MFRGWQVLTLVLAVAVLPGCNAIGVFAEAVSPPELIEAKYKLPDKPTLIVIDDWNGLVNSETMMRRIAQSTQAALEAEKVVTTGFVGQDELVAHREELGEKFRSTSLAKLAMHFGAKQVIHAEITGYQMGLAGQVIQPSISMNVKVYDLDARDRVFPVKSDPETGIDSSATVYPVNVKLTAKDISGQSASRSIAGRELAAEAGRDLGRLFFDWRKRKPGTDLEHQ